MSSYARLLPIALAMAATPAIADEEAFMVKAGAFNVTREHQHIDGAERVIKEGAENVYALAWEHRRADGAAFGLEFIRFDNDWQTSNSRGGDMTSRALLVTARRYVQTATFTFPYLGMGAGLIHANAGGASFDPGVGLALQLTGGIELRWQMAGIFAEAKGLYAETGMAGDKFNSSGIGVFGGVVLRF